MVETVSIGECRRLAQLKVDIAQVLDSMRYMPNNNELVALNLKRKQLEKLIAALTLSHGFDQGHTITAW
ncbi:MAG: hypothetical protein GY941_01700 [Planctomycetes bacterium]|nr:hypothetical protein [Planctomycetota bacterium]